MKNKLIYFILLFLFIFKSYSNTEKKIIVGSERLDQYYELIKNKSVGLLVNHTSMIANNHLIDVLLSQEINVSKIFTPEHGFKGNIERGKSINNDELLISNKKIPIISMYGKNRIPSIENLENIDVIIYDIQDVGARFYTYLSAMHNMMKLCAQLKIQFIVLDRPNPNGHYVDGPILEEEYKSYVGMHPIPIVHGCTLGEMAQMIKGENWIKSTNNLDLKIIKVKNWDHTVKYKIPIKPSPNLPNQQSILLYPSLCLFEPTIVSIGRGTKSPFQVIGHPKYETKEFSFIPKSVEAESKPKFLNQICYGINLINSKVESKIDLKYLIMFYNSLNKNSIDFFGKNFHKIAGNKKLEEQIKSGISEKEIRNSWLPGINKYKTMRKKYLLYKDFE
jgi:uncharacterized protein YbbC (DUF1343 family)|tara:strand:- start:296 stop:1468 length:1173 start_codon:yes stop_codon:yes gene_type:complete